MSTKSKGTAYEKYAEKICNLINKYYQFELVELKQNKKIVGESTVTHQIDIYWEFVYLGKKYKCIFECKDYKSRIPLEKIAALDSISHDIPGSIPFIISKRGFQSGALTYANKKNITPLIFRELKDDDWRDSIRAVSLDIHSVCIPDVRISFMPDIDWINNHVHGSIDFKKWRTGLLINNETKETISVNKFIEHWKKNATAPKTETVYFKDAFIKYEQEETHFKIIAITLSLSSEKIVKHTNLNINMNDCFDGIIIDVINKFETPVTKEGELIKWQK